MRYQIFAYKKSVNEKWDTIRKGPSVKEKNLGERVLQKNEIRVWCSKTGKRIERKNGKKRRRIIIKCLLLISGLVRKL